MSGCCTAATKRGGRTNILVLQVLQQLQLSVCPLGKHRCAEGLHDLLDGDILVGELVSGRAATENQSVGDHGGRLKVRERGEMTYQTRPKAPMPTGWRSEYLDVISKVVPKIWARTNSAMMGDGRSLAGSKIVGWRGNEGFRKTQPTRMTLVTKG